jgi:hypothetical protein
LVVVKELPGGGGGGIWGSVVTKDTLDVEGIQRLITYSLIPWCRILFEKLFVIQLVKEYPAFFMEPEGQLPCPQKPATGPYSEPVESSSSH